MPMILFAYNTSILITRVIAAIINNLVLLKNNQSSGLFVNFNNN